MSSKTGVIDSQLDCLSDCLEDFCTKHNLELMSADDILYGSSDTVSYTHLTLPTKA